MSLYVRVFTNFYTHRKTARLRLLIGNDAMWVPPRLWAYAAENQPDGNFSSYTADELAMQIGYSGDASRMLQALLEVGLMDADPLRIHDWHQHNGYHKTYSDRAAKAAKARWKGKDRKGKERKRDKHCLTNACSIDASTYPPDARVALFYLNEKTGRSFRETAANLSFISSRLRESGVSIEGVRKMIDRQCALWLKTPQAEYLRPETLFNATKFDGYYAAKDLPIHENSSPSNPNLDRNKGTLNAGTAHLYRNVGKVGGVQG